MRHTRPDWYKKYHTYTFSHYLHFAILIVFASGVGIALYQNLVGNKDILPSFAAPVAPPRVLSFQGRLTDNLDNPITTSTNIRFAIYDDASASGAALLWQEVLTSVTPDQDGIFSVILGNGTVIPTTVFSDNINTWLGVTIASTPELTPRQRIATVAYATNSEFLQGLPPITGTAATTNVVLALDASGNLTIGGSAAPTFTASGGQFKLSGQPLVLVTNSSSGGNIILIPDGLGKIDLEKPLINLGTTGNISQGAVEIDDKFAVLASESATAAFIVNNQSVGGDIFTASQGGTTKFVIDTNGNVAIGKRTANFTLDVAGTASISSTLSLGPSIQSDAGACAVATAGRMYYDGPANTYYYCNGTSWTQMGSGSGGSSFFRLTNGALSPINDTLDLLIGGVATSTAKIAFTGINTGGTPTASFSGNLSLQVPTGSAPSALFNVLNGGSLNFQTASTGQGDAGLTSRLFIANDGRIGINTSSPFTKLALDVRGLTGTTGTASISARSSFASLLVDNAGIGDIFVASQAGRTVLRIDNNGNLIVGANGGGKITADIVDPYLVQNQKTSGITSLTFQTMGASNADFIFQNVSTELSRLTQAGQFQLPITGSTGGIVLGGDAQLFRGAANRIDLSSGDSFNLVSGGLLVGGSTIIDSSGNGTFATLNVTSGCTGCGASGPNSPFQVLSGTIVPVNSTVDFLLGSQATTSAKFAVLNINGSTVPTASVSAQNAGGQALVLGGDGSLQTTRNNTLSLGGSTTGNIALLPRNAGGYVGINTSSPLSTLDVNGTLRVTNTADATDYFTLSSGNTSTTLSRTTNGSILGSVTLDNAGTLTAENVTVSSILNVSSFTGQSGGIIYANASGQVYQAAAGTGTQCLLGGTTPTWGSCSTGGTDSPFTTNLGAIVPGNITQDFLLGAQSTTSAKFAVLNMNGTGPATASVSGNLIVMPRNGAGGYLGIGTINPQANLDISSTNPAGTLLNLSNTALTTGNVLNITSTHSPSDGSTNEALDINITHSPTGSSDIFSSLNLTTTDSTSLGNELTGINNTLTLTGNAQKYTRGINTHITNSSTIGDQIIGGGFDVIATGGISVSNRRLYGIATYVAGPGTDTGGTTDIYGGYFETAYSGTSNNTGSTISLFGGYFDVGEGTLDTGGTLNAYGIYINNPSSNTVGNSTKYGLYLEPQTGADSNYGLCFDCDGSWDQNTVGSGIQFGTDANGVNLYRAANDTLRTDDNLSAGGFATISGNLTLEGVGRAVQSTDFNALTLGGTTTGDIILLPKDGIGTVSIPSTSTTGTVLSLAANSLTTGEAVDITTAITTNDTYGQLLDLNLTHTPTDDYGEFSGIDLSNNTSGSYEGTFFGIKNGLSLTGSSTNRNGYGIKNAVSTTSSSGTERLYGIYSSAVGAEDLSGSRNLTAIYGFASASSDGSGGTIVEKSIVGETSFWTTAATSTTVNMSALYALPDAPFILGGSPVVNSYGLNVQWEGFANTTGTTSQYSIYLDVPQGADNNYGICFDCDGTWDEINTTAAGIQFGTDANGVTLYRSASDTLKTDDAFNVAGNINLSSAGVASGLTGLTLASGPITLSASTGTGQCLIGGATASWGACGGGVAGSNWRLSSGALSPINDTLDLLVGSTSSSSAKFAVLNINGTATPVASVSATSGTDINKGIYLSGNGSIQSVRNNTLTIGGSTTGVTQLASQVIQFTGASQIIDTAVAGSLSFNTITNRPITTGTGLLTTGGNLSVNGSTTTLASTVINLTGNTPIIDLTHASTLSINTTTNRPITTGTGLLTAGGNLTVNGATTTLASTSISLSGASPILNLTHASTLSINTTTNRPITTGTGLLTAGGDLTVAGATTTFSNAAAVLTTGTNLPLTITPNGSGDLILSSDFDTGVYVGASTNTPAALSVTGGIGSNAGFIINRVGLNNDIIAASSAGVTRFVVKNDGTASSAAGFAVDAAAGLQSTRNQTLVLGGSSTGDINIVPRNGSGVLNLQLSSTNGLRMNGTFGAAVTGGNTCISDVVNGIVTGTVACAGGGGGSSNWRITTNTGALSPINNTLDILIGAQATSSAKFSVLNINGSASPFASVSATLASGGSGNGISIGGDGTLQTVRNNTLVLGGTTTGDIWFKPANNLGSLFLTSNGKVNIGTLQSPTGSIFGGKLNVFSNDAGPVASFSGRTSYAALVVDQASGSGDLIAASRSGQNVFRVFNDGTVDVGPAATGKLNAGTVDPPYTIDGQGYATYMPSMIGVKEEYTGKVTLGYNSSAGGYAYKLDFNAFEYKSGQWVYNRIIDPDISQISVLLSPNSQAKTWYKKDGANRTITLFADRPVEISYRLTAPRFDHTKWKTYTGEVKGHIAPPPTTNGSSANDNNIGADSYYNTLTINRESGEWVLKDVNNNNVNQMEAYGKVFVAQIKSGLVNTRELITDTFQASTASISTLTGNSFNFASGTISSLNSSMSNLGNATASSLNISTDNISIAGTSLRNYINETVTTLLATNYAAMQWLVPSGGNLPINPLAVSEQIRTNVISPLAQGGTVKIDGKLSIGPSVIANDSEAISLEVAGSASISGTLYSEVGIFESASISGNLAANTSTFQSSEIGNLKSGDATISGTLYANNIDGLDTRIANQLQNQQQASLSGNLASGNVETLHIGNLTADYGIFEQGIVALGPATFTSLTAMEQISIGDSFVIGDNAINTLGADLEIQPLRQGGVNFLAGLVKIDTNGNMDIAGNLNVLGNIAAQNGVFQGILSTQNLATELISPLASDSDISLKFQDSKFNVQDSRTGSGSSVLSINNKGDVVSSGSGTFAKLNFNIVGQAHATSDLEATATGSAGFATLKKNKPELTIYNPNVTEDSLIYITPFGDTQNKVLYLLRQVPDSEFESGSFTVGVSGPVINKDIQFNYLIVN